MIQEHQLAELGIFRIPVSVPFRNAGGPVNVYLIEEAEGFFLFDVGLGTEESQQALAEGIARTGHRLQDINRIVLSHGHIDHFGAAAWIQEQAGRAVPVLIHPADASKVLSSGPNWPELLMQNLPFLKSLGLPASIVQETIAIFGKNVVLGRRLPHVLPLLPGDKIVCRRANLEVLHMPGHTPGVCCLYEPSRRVLFSADHLLERVSPNPLIELGRDDAPCSYKPLITYFESLARLREIAIDLVLPGHAEPFADYLPVMDSLSEFYKRRQAKLLSFLECRPMTVFEAMKELFSYDTGIELILMLSETLGNLEWLEMEGRIVREWEGDIVRFRPQT